MEFKIGDKIYAKQYQHHGLELVDKEEYNYFDDNDKNISFLTIPIYMDGTKIEECNSEWQTMEYLKKYYVPISKIRKQKLEQLNKNL